MGQQKMAKVPAWLPAHASIKAARAHEADAAELVNDCGYSDHDMTSSGWVRIGEATISIELLPALDLTHQHIEALRKEQAEHQAKATHLESQIQSLMAIAHEA